MNWFGYASLFLISTFKFMFAPIGGPGFELSFIETYLSCAAGAILSSAVFFFSANYFMERARKKRVATYHEMLELGAEIKKKKVFTKMNKFIVRVKRTIGIIGISFWAPLFLSIPIGSIIAAKFYGHSKKTYPLIVVGIFLNGLVTTGIVYLF